LTGIPVLLKGRKNLVVKTLHPVKICIATYGRYGIHFAVSDSVKQMTGHYEHFDVLIIFLFAQGLWYCLLYGKGHHACKTYCIIPFAPFVVIFIFHLCSSCSHSFHCCSRN